MIKYLKSDEYYNDQYDRMTIETLKVFEAELIEKFKDCQDYLKITSAQISLKEKAISLAKTKRLAIEQWKNDDAQKDNTIARYKIPEPPGCDCGSAMEFIDYDFPQALGLNFIFSCSRCRHKNRVLDQYGSRILPKVKFCSYCNGKLVATSSRAGIKIIATDTCQDCGRSEKIEIEIPAKKKILPINEKERATYCTQFEGRRSFYEDLKTIADLSEHIRLKPDLSKIDMLKLPKLEQRLSLILEKSEFIKLTFQQPKIADVVIVMFSVEDISERDATQAAKELKKLLTAELFPTNWRLMATDIISRMGYLSGQLKGFDQPEHLQKLIREIGEKDLEK